jgi:peroxiredoxin Q/BCP
MSKSYSIPRVGETAPTFTLPASNGETIDLAKLIAAGRVVLYFYPRADTPGCTKEACGFRDARADYEKAKVAVLGISPDPVKDVTKFAEKFHLNFPLLADADHAVCDRYGAWQEKSMYGKKYWGAARMTFIINKGGKILHVFEKVKPEGHEKEVLEWLGSSRQ